MATIAQLNAEIGVNIQPLQQGLAAAESDIQNFGQDVASSANTATESLANLYQALDNLQAAQSRLPEGSANFAELGTSIQQVTAQIEVLEAAEEQATRSTLNMANATKQLSINEKFAATATEEATTATIANKEASNGLTGALGGLTKGFSLIRQAAYLIPGIGIAGIFNLIFEGVQKLASELDIFGSKANDLNPIIERLKKESQDFQDSLNKVQESALSTGIKLQSFVDIARDGQLPLSERNEALKQANKILGEHGEKLTLVNIYTKAVTDEVNNFTTALIAQAVAAKYADQIADQIIKNKNLLKEYTAAQQHLNDISNQRYTDGTFSTPYADAVKRVNDLALEYNQRLGSINNLYKDLNEETRQAISSFSEVGTKGKAGIDKVGDSLKRMYADLEAINQKGVLYGIDNVTLNKDYEKRVKDEINTLLNNGVAYDDIKIKDLQVLIESYQIYIDPYAQKQFQEKVRQFAEQQLKAGNPGRPDNTETLRLSQVEATAYALTEQLQEKQKKNREKQLKEDEKDTQASLKREAKFYEALGNEIKNAFEGVFDTLITKGTLSFESLAQSMEKLLANLAATAAEAAVLSLILSTITGGTNIAATLGAQGTGFLSIFKALIPHAEGGVFMGPTLIGGHLFAEKGPEALVPLNGNLGKFGGGQQLVVLSTVLKGNDIIIAGNRQDRYNKRNYGNFKR